MKKIAFSLVLLLLAGAILFAGCTMPSTTPVTPAPTTPAVSSSVQPLDTVKVSYDPNLGQYLVDADSYTLYYFLKDTPNAGTSACTGACITLWPAFSPGTIKVSSPLQASDFGSITRADGTMQATYKGWPLYRYSKDAAPGIASGNGYNDLWYVMGLGGVVTTAPTTTVATTVPVTTKPTTVPTTYRSSSGGGY
jgi:predicted lipoprotein with Yx(FWY)xxD motif